MSKITLIRDKKDNCIYKDEYNRTLIVLNNRQEMAIARYPNMNIYYKNFITEVYKDLVNNNELVIQDLCKFLNYEEDGDEFCA